MTPTYKLWKWELELRFDTPWREGGEAKLYQSPNGLYLYKVYHNPDDETVARVRRLVENPPSRRGMGFVDQAWAWPLDALLDERGKTVGCMMRRVPDAWPLAVLFHREGRLTLLPGLTTRHLAEVAANLFAVLEATHEQGIVLGDCSPTNVLFDARGGCTVIDLDSAQLTTRERVYRCQVATPEYLCPTLGALPDFASVPREPHHDVFSAAAIAYQLLNGGQHFAAGVAKPPKGQLPPPIARRVTIGAWPYTTRRDAPFPIEPLKDALAFEAFGPDLGSLFWRTFDDGFRDPSRRPSPAEFRDELRRFAVQQRVCPKNERHYVHGSLKRCPWCEVKRRAGVDPFPQSL
jgi:DNA-binding helix-hairpin-helix protein with protein kinase domain